MINSISDIQNLFFEKGIDISNIPVKEYEKTIIDGQEIEILERCQECGEIKTYRKNGIYEISVDCRCKRQERNLLKLAKYQKFSINDRNSGQDTFENVNKKLVNTEEKEIYKLAWNYCNEFNENLKTGKGFIFSGSVGSGKTFISNCICNKIKKAGYSVVSFRLSDYIENTKPNGKWNTEEFLQMIRDVDLIFVDDLGSEMIVHKDGTSWTEEKVYNLFDNRYNSNKPIIITTNLDKKGFIEHLRMNGQDRISSRLLDVNRTKVIQMLFSDKRQIER